MWSYEKKQEHLKKLYDEMITSELAENENQEIVFDDEDSEDEEDVVNESFENQDSDTEQEISEVESEEISDTPLSDYPYFLGKDNLTKWRKQTPPKNVRTRSENIVTHLPGPKGEIKNYREPLQFWRHFFDDNLLDIIVENTNNYIQTQQGNFSRARDANLTNKAEIQALIGLLYFAGVLKSSRMNTDDLWKSDGTGVEIFRLTMSQTRFRFLLRYIRFDDKESRIQRRELDKLAPIREIFDIFVTNCKSAYTPFHYVTIDEKLEAFRGRCSFRQYIPSKPNKYGLKIFALCDSKTYFTSNLEVYVGQQPLGPYQVSNRPSDVVQRLCEPIRGTGRNVTLDNWFTSMELVQNLKRNFRLTLLGTIRKNKRELPVEFSAPTGRPVGSSMFGFTEDCTLVSYVAKKNKNVLLVSSLHHDDCVDEASGKPEMILTYNDTKGGVDTVDKLCASYDCARNTRRWPMVVFYSMLNVAGINSMVLFSLNNHSTKKKTVRRVFLRQLSFDLLHEYLTSRAKLQSLPKLLRQRIEEIISSNSDFIPEENQTIQIKPNQASCSNQTATAEIGDNRAPDSKRKREIVDVGSHGRCKFCDRKKNRKTKYFCCKCRTYMCLEHCTFICRECSQEVENRSLS